MNLFRAELWRFLSRRFLHIMSALLLVILAAVAIGFAVNTQPVTAEALEQARARAAQSAVDERNYMEQYYNECIADVTSANPSGKYGTAQDCQNFLDKAKYISEQPVEAYLPAQFRLRYELQSTLYLAAAILGVFGFLIGASFEGAEWTSGGMTNLLLWRPRRIPVLATKLGTALLGVLVASAAYLAVWVGALWTVAATRGDTSGLTSGYWQSIALLCVRCAVLALAATAIGFALASLGRHTAAALGVGLGYALIVELGTLIVFGMLGTSFPDRFRLATYVIAWLNKREELYDYNICNFAFGECQPTRYVIDLSVSAAILGAVVLLLVSASMAVFHRRDVA